MSSPVPTGPRRTGILGGSFDPPHGGHLHAARAAREAFQLDSVRFVPAARSPHKPDRWPVSGEDRLALLELLIADEPDFVVDARELTRGGPSYTVETLRELAAESPRGSRELFLILGADNLTGLADWRAIEEILVLAQPVVIHREGHPEELLEALDDKLTGAAVERLRAGLVHAAPVEISSTELRDQLEYGGVPDALLPATLLDYINRARLYRETP